MTGWSSIRATAGAPQPRPAEALLPPAGPGRQLRAHWPAASDGTAARLGLVLSRWAATRPLSACLAGRVWCGQGAGRDHPRRRAVPRALLSLADSGSGKPAGGLPALPWRGARLLSTQARLELGAWWWPCPPAHTGAPVLCAGHGAGPVPGSEAWGVGGGPTWPVTLQTQGASGRLFMAVWRAEKCPVCTVSGAGGRQGAGGSGVSTSPWHPYWDSCSLRSPPAGAAPGTAGSEGPRGALPCDTHTGPRTGKGERKGKRGQGGRGPCCPSPLPAAAALTAVCTFKPHDRPRARRSGPAPQLPAEAVTAPCVRARLPPPSPSPSLWARGALASGCLAAASPRPAEPVGATCLPPTQQKEGGGLGSRDAQEPPTPPPGGRPPHRSTPTRSPHRGGCPTMPSPQGTEKAFSGSAAATMGSS